MRKLEEVRIPPRPILLQMAKYSEYMSDRDTKLSGLASKCAFILSKNRNKSKDISKLETRFLYILDRNAHLLFMKIK